MRPRENSADGKHLFKTTVPDKLTAIAIDAMSDLVAASEHWKYITQNLSTIDRCKLGRDILAKNLQLGPGGGRISAADNHTIIEKQSLGSQFL